MTAAAVTPFDHFAKLRRCPACRAIIAPELPVCGGCGRVLAAPHSDEWPLPLRRHLQVLCVERATPRSAGLRDEHNQLNDAGWRRLLLNAYRGTFVGEGATRRLLPWAVAADDCYLDALAAAYRWSAERDPSHRD